MFKFHKFITGYSHLETSVCAPTTSKKYILYKIISQTQSAVQTNIGLQYSAAASSNKAHTAIIWRVSVYNNLYLFIEGVSSSRV